MRKSKMLTLLAVAGYTYFLICLGMFFMQEKLLFHPGQGGPSPKSCNLEEVEELTIKTADGLNIALWHAASTKKNYPTLIYFHGNAGSLCDRPYKFRYFLDAGFGLLAVSYRGYGKSEGSPSENGIYLDAEATLHYARDVLKLQNRHIILYGESLGTGVAIEMATRMTPAMLVLEAPYTSIADRSSELYPYLPVNLLLKHRFDSIRKIGQVKTPLLIFHGERDSIVPVTHGRRILAAANEPKKAVFFKDNGHTDFDFSEITILMQDFAREHKLIVD